jgi:hypothetical protein
MTRFMPTPPKGLIVERQLAWAHEVLAPWVSAERRRQGQRAHNGRDESRDRRRAEREAWFVEQVASIDRATLIARLDEVDPAELGIHPASIPRT